MNRSLQPLNFQKWLQLAGMLAVTTGFTLPAFGVNPGTSNPPGKSYGEVLEKDDNAPEPAQNDGTDCDGTQGLLDRYTNPLDQFLGEPTCSNCPPDEGPGCIREEIPLAVSPNEPGLGSGMLKLYVDATGSNLGSRQYIDYFGLPQMAITEQSAQSTATDYKIIQAGSTLIPFRMDHAVPSGQSMIVGKPMGGSAYSQARLTFCGTGGTPTDKTNATSVRHYRGAAGFCDYPVNGGTVTRYETKQGRVYNFPLANFEVIRERGDGTKVVNGKYGDGQIRQVKTVSGLLDVVVLTERSYEVRKYAPEQIGSKTNGVFTVTGSPYLTMKVEAPVDTQNKLIVTRTEGSFQTVSTYECTMTPSFETWTQNVVAGDFQYKRTLSRTALANPDYRQNQRTCKVFGVPAGNEKATTGDTPDYVLMSDTYKFCPTGSKQQYPAHSANPANPKESVRDCGFPAPSWDPNGVGRPTTKTNRKGTNWVCNYQEDTGRMTKRTTHCALPANTPTQGHQIDVIEDYQYAPLGGANEQQTPGDFRPRTTQKSKNGIQICKYFFSARKESGKYVETNICALPGGSYSSPGAGATKHEKRWIGTGAFTGYLEEELGEDGTLTRYEYAQLSNSGLELTKYNRLSAAGDAVSGYSTREKHIRDARGWPTAITTAAWVNGSWVDYETIQLAYNGAGRLTQKTRLDPISGQTRVLLQQEWDGPLLTREVNEEGIATAYEYYSGSKIVKKVTREAVASQGGFAAQPAIVTTYTGTFTANQSQLPEWKQRIATTTAGSLTLTETQSYDERGRLTSSTDHNGYTTTIAYTENENVKTEELPSGAERITKWDSSGRTISITGNAQTPQFFHYAPKNGGMETTVRLGAENSLRMTVTETDEQNRVVKVTTPKFGGGNTVTSYDYSATLPKNLTKIVKTGEATKFYDYNPVGGLNRQGSSEDDGTLDLNSQTDRIVDYETAVQQDGQGVWLGTKTRVYHQEGSSNNKLVDMQSQLIGGFPPGIIAHNKSTDIAGNLAESVTSLSGAIREQIGTRSGVSGQVITRFFSGRRMSLELPGITGLRVWSYDDLGRMISEKNPRHLQAGMITYIPEKNQVASQRNAAGDLYSYTYYPQGSNGAGEIMSVTLPDNSVQYKAYTQCGDVKVEWGSQKYPTWREYDEYCELIKLYTWKVAPDLNVYSLPQMPPSEAVVTKWNYDPGTGLLASKRYDADASVSNGPDYEYDSAGRLTKRTWARMNGANRLATTYGWNDFGQLTSINYADLTPNVAQIFDRLGRMISQSNGVATSTFGYSPVTLQLANETVSYDLDTDSIPELVREIVRTHDSYLRSSGYQLKVGSTVEDSLNYGYDAAGRLDTVGAFTYGYTVGSNLIGSVNGPAHTVTNKWEPNRDVLDVKENKVGTNMISRFDYGVNEIGQRTGVTKASDFFATSTIGWGYDTLGQVVSADDSANVADRSYQYDAIGNRMKSADTMTLPGSINYLANNLNQYTTIASINPVYDADGNARSYPVPTAPSANAVLEWDAENRMVSSATGSDTTGYVYDAMSRRIAKVADANSTMYLYDGWNCIAEYKDLSLSKTYQWGLDLSGSTQGAGGVGGLLAVGSGSVTHYPVYDGNGNVTEYLTSSGSIAAHFEYDPFGRTVVDNDTPQLFDIRFSSKRLDGEIGFYYFGYRYYSPQVGGWISRDPYGEAGGVNVYGMVDNSANNLVDILGLLHCVCNCDGAPDLTQMVNDEINSVIGGYMGWQGGATSNAAGLQKAIEDKLMTHSDSRGLMSLENKLKSKGKQCQGGAAASTFMLCGECVGSDKIGHFLEQGLQYHDIAHRDKKGRKVAEDYGKWTEGMDPHLTDPTEYDYFETDGNINLFAAGSRRNYPNLATAILTGSKVISFWGAYGDRGFDRKGNASPADLAANSSGLEFWEKIHNSQYGKGKGPGKIDICSYVNDGWNHMKHPNVKEDPKPGRPNK